MRRLCREATHSYLGRPFIGRGHTSRQSTGSERVRYAGRAPEPRDRSRVRYGLEGHRRSTRRAGFAASLARIHWRGLYGWWSARKEQRRGPLSVRPAWHGWLGTLGLFCLPKPASRFGPPLPTPNQFLGLSTLRPSLRFSLRSESPKNRNCRKVVTPAV